jgi:hypothetical protein
MSPMREIVKVQIFFHAGPGKVSEVSTVNAKGHRPEGQWLDPATRAAMGDDTRAFFDAEYQPSTGRWSIGTRVMDRDW